MRCFKIRFDGYKRLAATGCNVDGRIIAFVGPNEVGKTSLLQGLEWLTEPGTPALPSMTANRSTTRTEKQRIVSATYRLADDDRAVLADLGLAEMPVEFYMERRSDGSIASSLTPDARRNPAPFEMAGKAIGSAAKRLAAQLRAVAREQDDDEEEGEDEEHEATADDWMTTVIDVLRRTDDKWSDRQVAHAENLIAWLREVAPTSRKKEPRDKKGADLLEAALAIGRKAPPDSAARTAITKRVPRFVRFSESDRELSMTHNVADDQVRESPTGALANLLAVAEIDLEKLWELIQQQDTTRRETMIRQGNERLRKLFTQAWNQADITVYLNLSGSLLEIMVDELDDAGSRTSIEERSDGLQTFIALVAFLARQNLRIPPILLVDEAETHLHLDAQADLVDVLLKNLDATQVFYTTHSPGCLPRDLGTGVRLVGRDPKTRDASLLRSDFWTNKEPGFSSLLFAMGASAAAFSVCRRAVLAEGAADMILLPSLLRAATGLEDLGYQVAPGLSNAHAYGMDVEEVAARVVYLTDGDPGGKALGEQLVQASVRKTRIFSLPKDKAPEDLLNKDYYIATVNQLVPDTPDGTKFTKADVKSGQPIGKSLADWKKKTGAQAPGKVAVASAIAGDSDNIVLAGGAANTLLALHAKFLAALDQAASGAAAQL